MKEEKIMEEKYCPMTRSACVGDLCEWYMEDPKSCRGGMCAVYHTALILTRNIEAKQNSDSEANQDFPLWDWE